MDSTSGILYRPFTVPYSYILLELVCDGAVKGVKTEEQLQIKAIQKHFNKTDQHTTTKHNYKKINLR
jgi:hypothetical protein